MNRRLFIFIAVMGLIQGLNGSEEIVLRDNQAHVGDIEDFRVHRTYAIGSGLHRNQSGPRTPPPLSIEQLIPLIPLEEMRDSDEDNYDDADFQSDEDNYEDSENEVSFFNFIDR